MNRNIQEGICGTKEERDGDKKITLDIPGGNSFAGARVNCPHLLGNTCEVNNEMCLVAETFRELRLPAGL